MNIIEAVGICFYKYSTFRGRARRSEFWYWVLFTLIVGIVLSFFDVILFGTPNLDNGPLNIIFSLFTFIPNLSVAWRRLHDTNRSGWWIGGAVLAFFILGITLGVVSSATGNSIAPVPNLVFSILPLAILGYFVLIIFFWCQNSHYGPNKYGENPKGEGNTSVFD